MWIDTCREIKNDMSIAIDGLTFEELREYLKPAKDVQCRIEEKRKLLTDNGE